MGYLGSKSASGAYQAIIALMPPHDTYVELFAGSGAVLIRKPQAASSFAVDLDARPLAGWHRREFQSMTRGGPRTEQLWYNFEPRAVQWCTFAGRGFTDRQRIKRKAARWAQNFRRMPPAERTAVLAAILQADPA